MYKFQRYPDSGNLVMRLTKMSSPGSILSLACAVIGVIALSISSMHGDVGIQGSDAPLIVEEYRIVSQEVDTPDHVEFSQRINSEVREKRKKWRESGRYKDDMSRIDAINSQLEAFIYELRRNEKPARCQPSYDLYHNGSFVVGPLATVRGFRLSEKGDRFLFVAYHCFERGSPDSRNVLVYNGEIRDWNMWKHAHTFPIFADDTLMSVERLTAEIRRASPDVIHDFAVKKEDRTVYAFSACESADKAIRRVSAFKNQWILERTDTVIVNGIDIGEKNGYSKVFYYRGLKGKPFYFFEHNGKIHISYGGKILPYTYEEVIHNMCCEPAAFNVTGNEYMVHFYALRDGFWYYVEAGIYE